MHIPGNEHLEPDHDHDAENGCCSHGVIRDINSHVIYLSNHASYYDEASNTVLNPVFDKWVNFLYTDETMNEIVRDRWTREVATQMAEEVKIVMQQKKK